MTTQTHSTGSAQAKWIVGVIVLVLVIFGIYFANEEPQEASGEPIKIGVATLLSGDFAALGDNIVNASRLTVDQINAEGGVNGRPLALVIQDAGLTSREGLNATQKLINTDQVNYIIAGMSSNGRLAAAPLANEHKVLLLSPTTGGNDVNESGEYVFRIANNDERAGTDIANAMKELGFTRVGVVAEVTEYTQGIQNSFESAVESIEGLELVVSESFAPQTTDFRTIVSKIRSVNPEALLVVSQTGVGGAQLIKQAQDIGYGGPFFTDFTFIANPSAEEIIGSFEGIYFADPAYSADSTLTEQFFTEYEQRFESRPFIPFHAAATRDSIVLLAEAMREVGDDSEAVHDWLLENVKDWEGLMGVFSLDEKGNSDLGFEVKVIQNGEPTPISI